MVFSPGSTLTPPEHRNLEDESERREGRNTLNRRVTVRLSEKDFALLGYLAETEGLKPSQVVRALVVKFLRHRQRNLTSLCR